ncbi:MAG TPA: hypothetical protein VGD99_21880 [Anaerolineae bacterium]|jgi:hypothetical protein
MLTNSNATATIDQSVNLPDYFSCRQCTVWDYGGRLCDRMQQAGRCRAAALGRALDAGHIQITLHLPAEARR